jgi:hypothetical protein
MNGNGRPALNGSSVVVSSPTPLPPLDPSSRLTRVATRCIKLGGVGTLLALPLGKVNLVAGEATFIVSLATTFGAGAVAVVSNKRDRVRELVALRRRRHPDRTVSQLS